MTEKNTFPFQKTPGHILVQTVELLHWTPIIFAKLRVWHKVGLVWSQRIKAAETLA